MIHAPASPFRKRRTTRRHEQLSPPESTDPVDVVVPNLEHAALLLAYAVPLFPAEIVPDSTWIVRLQPPIGAGWIIELLSVVDRWLESATLPSAKVRYDGRSYMVRASRALAG
jgi:hypothetical protein